MNVCNFGVYIIITVDLYSVFLQETSNALNVLVCGKRKVLNPVYAIQPVVSCVRPRNSYFWNILDTEIDCRLLLTVRRVVRRVIIYHFACLASSDPSVC